MLAVCPELWLLAAQGLSTLPRRPPTAIGRVLHHRPEQVGGDGSGPPPRLARAELAPLGRLGS